MTTIVLNCNAYSQHTGITEILVMYPLDVVKTQWQLNTGKQRQSVFSTLATTVKERGYNQWRVFND